MRTRPHGSVACLPFCSFYRPIPVLLTALLMWLCSAIPLQGQQNPLTQILGNADQGIVLPQKTPLLPRQDAGALAEILAYRSAISLGSWLDMQATGQLTSTASGSSGPENATLWIRNHHGYRLDVQKPKGMSSLRMDGAYGAVQHADGQMMQMDARDAVAGLLAFPALMEANFPTMNVMLIDQGMATVDGTALHRITVEKPWPGDPLDATGNPLTTVADLYFDPQTHLLVKSALGIFGSQPSPEKLLEVTSYGSYSAANGMLVPHSYRQTLNGQILWTLQLNQIHLNQGLPQSDFHF